MSASSADVARAIIHRCAAGRVRQISRIITARYDTHLREVGVTANQLTILAVITVLGPSRSSDIEPFLAMEQSTLSRNLSRMVDNGWLARRVDREDGRSSLLEVTAAGAKVLEEAYEPWSEAQAWTEELLGDEGIDSIASVARKVNPRIP